ncbi:hypothetical protein ACFOMD_02010 [Sphingoaurantiacus capsulatus]|uniref:Nucleotidyl transferase AbiEii/AbiGii toxin family protein n=1 Tax=Sphingoaurantiacus capsulatus TaxID=1771310 RepID=A0ABV7X675_9SPHN
MVIGIDRFREHFAGHEHQYVLIGGSACDLIMGEAGLDFRATKDLDIVLIVEAIDPEFSHRFMEFIEAGQYEVRERSEGDSVLYRFQKPATDGYPKMLELFSSAPEGLSLPAEDELVRLPIGEAAASLSAILLDPDYYAFLKGMIRRIDDIPILDEAGLIPFKARAWIDLSRRREAGEPVDARDITKHRRDVVRLVQLIAEGVAHELPPSLYADLTQFIDALAGQGDVNPKDFGVPMSLATAVERLRAAYHPAKPPPNTPAP